MEVQKPKILLFPHTLNVPQYGYLSWRIGEKSDYKDALLKDTISFSGRKPKEDNAYIKRHAKTDLNKTEFAKQTNAIKDLGELFKELNNREKVFLIDFFGIVSKEPKTLTEIAEHFDSSCKITWQTQYRVFLKLGGKDFLTKTLENFSGKTVKQPTYKEGIYLPNEAKQKLNLPLEKTKFAETTSQKSVNALKNIIKNLDNLEKHVFLETYGIVDGEPKLQSDIAKPLGKSQRYIGIVLEKALIKIDVRKNAGIMAEIGRFKENCLLEDSKKAQLEKLSAAHHKLLELKIEDSEFAKTQTKGIVNKLKKSLEKCSPLERVVILEYYGIHDGKIKNHKDINNIFNKDGSTISRWYTAGLENFDADLVEKLENFSAEGRKHIIERKRRIATNKNQELQLSDEIKKIISDSEKNIEKSKYASQYGATKVLELQQKLNVNSSRDKNIFYLWSGIIDGKPRETEDIAGMFRLTDRNVGQVVRNVFIRMEDECLEAEIKTYRENLINKTKLADLPEDVKSRATQSLYNSEFARIYGKEKTERLTKIIDALEPQKRDMFILRFGILDGECIPSDKIGEKYDLTQKQVRTLLEKIVIRRFGAENADLIADIKGLKTRFKNKTHENKMSDEMRKILDFDIEKSGFASVYGEEEAIRLKTALDKLDTRERVTILLTYGIPADKYYTEREISEILGHSKDSTVSGRYYKRAVKSINDETIMANLKGYKEIISLPEDVRDIIQNMSKMLSDSKFFYRYGAEDTKILENTLREMPPKKRVVLIKYKGIIDSKLSSLTELSGIFGQTKSSIQEDLRLAGIELNKAGLKEKVDSLHELFKLPREAEKILDADLSDSVFAKRSKPEIFNLLESELSKMNKQDKYFILRYYGIIDGKPKSYEELSKITGFTYNTASEYKRRIKISELLKNELISYHEFLQLPPKMQMTLDFDLTQSRYVRLNGEKSLEQLQEFLSKLSHKERYLVLEHYGIIDGKPKATPSMAKPFHRPHYYFKTYRQYVRDKYKDTQAYKNIVEYKNLLVYMSRVQVLSRLNLKNTVYEEKYGRGEFLKLQRAIQKLSGRERNFLILHYGIQDGKPKTIVQAGNILGLSQYTMWTTKQNVLTKPEISELIERLEAYTKDLKTLKHVNQEELKHLLILENTMFEKKNDKETFENFKKLFERLANIEKIILSLYYGIHDGVPKTLKEIEVILNSSASGIHIIKEDVLQKNPNLENMLDIYKKDLKGRYKPEKPASKQIIPEHFKPLLSLENTVFEQKHSADEFQRLVDGFSILKPRERIFLSLYYGIHDGKSMRYQEIADIFSISSTGVRIICIKALERAQVQDKEFKNMLEAYLSLINVEKTREPSGQVIPEHFKPLLSLENTVFEQKHSADEFQRLVNGYSILGPRRKILLSLYYGIHDGKPMIYQEVADIFKVSRQRVQQLCAKALKQVQIQDKDFGNMLDDYRDELNDSAKIAIEIPKNLEYLLKLENTAFEANCEEEVFESFKCDFETLLDIEKVILGLYYRIQDGKSKEIDEIAKAVGCSHSTLIQIKNEALSKIQEAKALTEFSRLAKWSATRDYNPPEVRNELMEKYYAEAMKIGGQLAYKFNFQGNSDDIIMDGLYGAAKTYKPIEGKRFEALLYHHIKGGFLRHINNSAKQVSLDEQISGEDAKKMDFIADKKSYTPQKIIQTTVETEELYEALKTLPENIRQVISLNFGLEGKTGDIKEIAEKMNISRTEAENLLLEGFSMLKTLIKSS